MIDDCLSVRVCVGNNMLTSLAQEVDYYNALIHFRLTNKQVP